MQTERHPLLIEIEAFLAETGLSESYFGKAACKNSELIPRLRANKRGVWPDTEAKIRAFMAERRSSKQEGAA